jgi:hypothetical protein
MEKRKRRVLKAREKQAIDCCNEIFWSFYIFINLNDPTTTKINFDLTEI